MNEAAGAGPSFLDDCPCFEAQVVTAAVGGLGETCQVLRSHCLHYFSVAAFIIAATSSHPQLSDAGAREVQWHFPGQAPLHFGRIHRSQSTYEKTKPLGKC